MSPGLGNPPTGGLLGGLGWPTPTKHKIFVSYHHRGDQAYYDAFSNAFHDTYDVMRDNSVDREIDSDDVEYVMRCIRENYITGSSCTVVLVGEKTWGRKFVDWEIEATLDKGHGLIGVYLPTASRNPHTNKITVPNRLFDNIESGFAVWRSWERLNVAQLQQDVAEARFRNKVLIDNSRARRLRNA
jgi:MTH538 TIR-like domain (DUF1863)